MLDSGLTDVPNQFFGGNSQRQRPQEGAKYFVLKKEENHLCVQSPEVKRSKKRWQHLNTSVELHTLGIQIYPRDSLKEFRDKISSRVYLKQPHHGIVESQNGLGGKSHPEAPLAWQGHLPGDTKARKSIWDLFLFFSPLNKASVWFVAVAGRRKHKARKVFNRIKINKINSVIVIFDEYFTEGWDFFSFTGNTGHNFSILKEIHHYFYFIFIFVFAEFHEFLSCMLTSAIALGSRWTRAWAHICFCFWDGGSFPSSLLSASQRDNSKGQPKKKI